LGGQGISIISYSRNQEEAKKFLEWLVRDDIQARWAELGGYTAHAKTLESQEFRNATPYNEAFYQSMFVVKDFWAVPYYAELLQHLNDRLGPYVVGSESSAREALNALAADWQATIAKYGCD
jgi:multiple sugar transport system substrate-binding protein